MKEKNREEAKRRAGESAVEVVEDGDVVGLGTGTTAAYAVSELGRRIEDGLDIRGVPTSYGTRTVARRVGVPLVSLEEATPDVTIDGADAFDEELNLIKGGGAAHTREKVVANASDRLVVVADETKKRRTLDVPVPVECLSFALAHIRDRVEQEGGLFELRESGGKDGPVVTDNGNIVADTDFGEFDPQEVAEMIGGIAGVVEHGIFLNVADEVRLGTEDGLEVIED